MNIYVLILHFFNFWVNFWTPEAAWASAKEAAFWVQQGQDLVQGQEIIFRRRRNSEILKKISNQKSKPCVRWVRISFELMGSR